MVWVRELSQWCVSVACVSGVVSGVCQWCVSVVCVSGVCHWSVSVSWALRVNHSIVMFSRICRLRELWSRKDSEEEIWHGGGIVWVMPHRKVYLPDYQLLVKWAKCCAIAISWRDHQHTIKLRSKILVRTECCNLVDERKRPKVLSWDPHK